MNSTVKNGNEHGLFSIERPDIKYRDNDASEIEYPNLNLWELLEQSFLKFPNNIAINYYGTKITYIVD